MTVLLGNGAGGFTAAPGSPFAVGLNPTSVAVADFNGDGKLDLVTANGGSNNVTVLLGNGAGGFAAAPKSPFTVGSSPQAVAVGDFNGDGNLDFATTNPDDSTMTVMLGNGSGGFASALGSPFTVGLDPFSAAVGDVNGDGKLDLVTANGGSNNVTVLLGTGSGGFTPAPGSPFTVGLDPGSVAMGDFDGDGKLDLATANTASNNVTVLLGNGAGGFTPAPGSPFTVGSSPQAVVVGDFNGDGNLDLAIAIAAGNNVTVLIGNGEGSFTVDASGPFAVGPNPLNVAVGDFNGDGRPDLAAPNRDGDDVSVLLNTTPAFAANPASLTFYGVAGQAQSEIIPVTVTSTSIVDVYTATPNQPFISVIPTSNPAVTLLSASAASLGAGTYSGTVRYSQPNDFDAVTSVTFSVANPSGTLTKAPDSPFAVGNFPYSVAVGDFNGDGNLDLATANLDANNVTVLLGDGAGGFTSAPGSPFAAGTAPVSVAVGDFNRDGKLDLATANGSDKNVTVLLGNGRGGFTPAPGSPYSVGSAPRSVATGDFNGDGRLDLATANSGANNVTVLLGDGAGGFTPAPGSSFLVGSGPQTVALGDFNGDGKLDLATASTVNNNVTVLLGNGMGGFTAAPGSPFAVGSFPNSMALGDFNGDGRLDLATANAGSNNVTVLLGDGLGGFTAAPGSPFAVGSDPISLAVGDFNGDGRVDLSTVYSNNVSVLLGNGMGGFTPAPGSPFAVGIEASSVAAADFNRDGKLDLAVSNGNGNSVTVLLGGIATTTSVLSTTTASTITVGTPVPLTLTVSAANALSTPSGTVTFLDGATVLGTATQTGSPYTFTITTLSPGVHNLTATYGGDVRNAKSTSNTVTITVSGIAPVLTWSPPAPIVFGSALSSIQLDATANVPGTFAYTPGVGTVLPIGSGQTLSVTFTPTDTTDYTTATGSTTINVNPAGGVPVNLVTTKVVTRSAGNLSVQLTVADTGQTGASNVAITSVTINAASATRLPASLGTIAGGTSATTTVSVPGSAGASGSSATFAIHGTYNGGTFNSTGRLTLP